MLSDCLSCRKDTENKNPRISNTTNEKIMILSKSAMGNSQKSRFIKDEEGSRLLSQLGFRTPLSQTPLLDQILIKKFLLGGDKLMPETDLGQPAFTYCVCGLFTKNKERIKIQRIGMHSI